MSDIHNDKVSELVKIPENNRCLDCNITNTQWTSITYGIFLCLDCASIHRSLGVKTSFVKSVNMDKWGKKEYLFLKFGGNKKFKQLLEKNDLLNKDINKLYFEESVKNYGRKLKSLVFEELGINEDDYENIQIKRKVENINSWNNKNNESKSYQEETNCSKFYGSLSFVKSKLFAGVKELKNITFEYGEKISKNVLIPTTKIIKSQTSNLSGIWKQEIKKDKEESHNYMKFDDEEIEDMRKWD